MNLTMFTLVIFLVFLTSFILVTRRLRGGEAVTLHGSQNMVK